jgi:hypothetical protein
MFCKAKTQLVFLTPNNKNKFNLKINRFPHQLDTV